MEQLLARNRRPGDYSPAPAYEPVYESHAARLSSTASTELESDGTPTAASVDYDPNDRSHLDSAPRHQVDKHDAREKIQSFREVANISARTALARHRWRVDRAEIAVHGMLTLTTAAMGAFFMYPPLWEGVVHWPRGAGCLIASAWSLKKCLAAMHRLRKFRVMENRVKNMTAVGKGRAHRPRTPVGDASQAEEQSGAAAAQVSEPNWLPDLTPHHPGAGESAPPSPAE
jgi:hypothetical protein